MPRLVKGAKWTYGWVVVGPGREIAIPPRAWQEFGFRAWDAAVFTPGSQKSGGFAISTEALAAEAEKKMDGAKLRELGRSKFDKGWVTLPAAVDVTPGARLLAVRGSCYGLGFVARGPIYAEALGHSELEAFQPRSRTAHRGETPGGR